MAKAGRTITDWMVVEEGSPSLKDLSASVSEALSLILEWIRQQPGGTDTAPGGDVDL